MEDLEIIDDLGEVELEDSKFTYEVWALGYDDHYNAVNCEGCEVLMDDGYTELTEAKKCFDYLLKHKELIINKFTSDEIIHVNLVLEQCVDHGDEVECIDFVEEVEIF